jgi:hypothetical protein
MRAPFQEGDFPGPVKYGYVSVGVVDRGPAALRGRTVFCLYPHQTAYVVPAAAVTVVPEGVPPNRAVLAGAVETAVNALWAGPLLDDRVTVVGAGTPLTISTPANATRWATSRASSPATISVEPRNDVRSPAGSSYEWVVATSRNADSAWTSMKFT